MAEWLKASVLKTDKRANVSRVRIPLSPPSAQIGRKKIALLQKSFLSCKGMEKGGYMKIVPADIAHKAFNKKLRGYDPKEVLEFLQDVAYEMEALIREKNNTQEVLRDKEIQILKYKERDKTLKDTIETAQKMGKQIKEECDREGRLIINDAQQKAQFIVRDAKDSLKRTYHEISELKRTKVQIEANLRALLQAHLQLLNEQITALPEVEMPQDFLNDSPHQRPTNDPKQKKPVKQTTPLSRSQPSLKVPSSRPASSRSAISPVSS